MDLRQDILLHAIIHRIGLPHAQVAGPKAGLFGKSDGRRMIVTFVSL